MLTQNDLTQIKTIVEDVVDNKFKKELGPVKKDIKIIHKQINKIQKDTKIIINYFDTNYVNHEKRIGKIERHLGFSQ